MGLYLDIVPRGVNKGSALRLLADRWHIEAEDTIACGDSANDISMLKHNKAIIVGNAKEELLQWALQAGNGNIFLAKGFYAQGIIEGFAYYGV
jgi:hydroxymethylpyrimidine pyrophosphatase-like HAD family hydrolase